MNATYPRPTPAIGVAHPVVISRRVRELLVIGAVAALAAAITFAVSVAVPKPSLVETVGAAILVVAVLAFALCTRAEVTVTALALYLGLVDGPIKLLSASQAASGLRDVLIGAVCLGMLVRLVARRERVQWPALSGWVIAFIAVVVAEAANPGTSGVVKVLAGFRQQLEWVPFFFFGYMVVRTKVRFRNMFLILGVIALANGVIGAYQGHISPDQLASWGPGYNARIKGNGVAGRTYSVEGVRMSRPLALGSDSGFGGGVGLVALPGLLALLSVGRVRRVWVMPLLLGALLGIATSASRTSIVIAAIMIATYAALALFAKLRLPRLLASMAVIGVLCVIGGGALIAFNGKGIFHRQESINLTSISEESKGSDNKTQHLTVIAHYLERYPFGIALGDFGAVAGFGGHSQVLIGGKLANGESAYQLLAVELGFPGLLLWVGLTLNIFVIVLRGLRKVRDEELRTYLLAVFVAFVGFTIEGFSSPTLAVSPAGTLLWFAPGVLAYWFAGPGRALAFKNATAPGVEAQCPA